MSILTTMNDVMADEGSLNASIDTNDRGIFISLEGHEDYNGGSEIVMVELCEGEARVVIWADPEQEDPSHIIPLGKTKVKPVTRGRWFSMDKADRLKLLCQEFSISEKEAEEIYDDDPNNLPDEIKEYFVK